MYKWEAKDAQTDPTQGSQEPEVIKSVLSEIKKLGDNYKQQYDDLNRRYSELKDVINNSPQKTNALIDERINKFTEDISTRQAALDAANQAIEEQQSIVKSTVDRLDKLEVMLQRTPQAANKEVAELEYKHAYDFMISNLSYGKDVANYHIVKKMTPNVKEYKNYERCFEEFCRARSQGQTLVMEPDDVKALSVGQDPSGGYTVPTAMSSKIFSKLYETDPMRRICNVETITTNSVEFPVDWDEASVGWEEETKAGSPTDTPQFKVKRIPVFVLYAKPLATQTLLEDSSINIQNWLTNKVSDKFARTENAAFVTGDGIGKPRGFTTWSDGTYGTVGYIYQCPMGHASALTADGFISVKFSLVEQYMNNAVWLMARSTVAAAMKLKFGDGHYIWSPGLTQKEPSTILGDPLYMSTTMPTVAANAVSVAYGNFKEAYTIVDRLGISLQRDPFTRKPFVEFYFRKRVGGDVTNWQSLVLGKVSAS